MEYCYVLFTRTGFEVKVRTILAERLDSNKYQPFVPNKVLTFRRHGVDKKEYEICFPGYVFIRSIFSPAQFLRKTFPTINLIKYAYKFLCYGDDRRDIAMRKTERIFLDSLLNDDFLIDESVGIIVGEKIRIVSGALVGMEGMVKGIKRHRREALIELPIMDDIQLITVGLEIVERI